MVKPTAIQDMSKEIAKKECDCNGKYEKLLLFLKKGPYSDIITGNYSDFKLNCKGVIFHLHRNIVCPQSSAFTNLLAQTGTGDYGKECYNKQQNTIYLTESSPRHFDMLIQLMYLHCLDDEEISQSPLTVLDYIKLYAIAGSFANEAVQDLVLDLIKSQIVKICNGFQTDNPVTLSNWHAFTEITKHINSMPNSARHESLITYIVHHAALNWKYINVGDSELTKFFARAPKFMIKLLARMAKLSTAGGERGKKRTIDDAFPSDC